MSILLDNTSTLVKGNAPAIDIGNTFGQQGVFLNRANWAANARYIKQRMIPFLIEGPKLAKYFPDEKFRLKVLRSLMEERATNITGITSTITAEFNETVEGNAGDVRESLTKTTYERATPSYEWPELYGKPINSFWENYITSYMSNPYLGVPDVVNEETYRADANRLPLIEANMSFIMLFVEPSPDMRTVVDAVLVANMMPKTGGEHTMQRVVGEAGEAPVVSIEFTGIADRSRGVFKMAQDRLDALNREQLNIARLSQLPSFAAGVSDAVDATGNGFFSAVN